MKIFTKLSAFILLFCVPVQWANAQANCDAIVPELPTEAVIPLQISSTITLSPLSVRGDLPDLEYAIQVVGIIATDSLSDQITGFTRNASINVDDFGLKDGDRFRVTPIAYDLSQVQTLITLLFEGNFLGLPCCTIAGLSLPGVCERLESAGLASATDITGLSDITQVLTVFNEDPDLTYSVPGFISVVDGLNEGASALPASCGGNEIPICYASPLGDTGTQLYDIITNFPIELASFKAYPEQKHNYLKWTTATEENNAYFSIQRSANGQDFVQIGRIGGSGTTTEAVDYEFIDDKPLGNVNYYRLQQVDFDGKSSFSDIIGVVRKDADILDVISVGPNPNNGEMDIVILDEESGRIDYVITDINGKNLAHNTLTTSEGLNTFKVNITDYPAGIYFISIVKGEFSTHLKFLKK